MIALWRRARHDAGSEQCGALGWSYLIATGIAVALGLWFLLALVLA